MSLYNMMNGFNPACVLIIGGKIKEVSKEYIEYLKEFYPKLAEQGVIDKIFND